MDTVINLLIIAAIGVILANLVANRNNAGLKAITTNVTSIWTTAVDGMLGKTS